MNINNKIFLALDTATEHGAVTLFDHENIYYSKILSDKYSHSQLVCVALSESIALLKLYNKNLSAVFVGLGPGSFVGLRVALATALGFCFGREIPLMGFCSHQAIAFSLDTCFLPKLLSIATKASGDLCYLSSYDNNQELVNSPEVIAKREILATLSSQSLLVTNLDFENLPSDMSVIKCQGPTAQGLQKAALSKLKLHEHIIDESAYIKPNYIKNPSVSIPAFISAKK
jgi:tRNA threonylcarbamoyl adenosine modification protein YeaZ